MMIPLPLFQSLKLDVAYFHMPSEIGCPMISPVFQSLKRDVAYFHSTMQQRQYSRVLVSIAQARCGLLPREQTAG